MAAASRRGSSRIRIAEANENDELRDVIDPIPFPPPRSPLISIPDPAQNPRGVILTPKASHSTPARAASRFHAGNGVRERSCLKGIGEAKSLVPVEVPYFELKEDPSFWEDHNVQVLIRIRPINVSESTLHGYNRCLTQENSQTLTWTGHPESRFTFDNIACETMSQEKLFRVVGLPMVESCMSGYNGCMFAYGQTGSGKTYTMMGELRDLDNTPSNDRGMTPRIFEYLFTRIREEEECRSNEQLRYNCKCSFLEIYNEQITDLLEPSSTNLQLREDMKKGVYVENLSEHDVSSVKDVVELLLQGAANRKMAATNMNSESSRSHSVFTCVIESRWETDSMTHLRYGRLNLVDLAGSERQKSSGAEGERLKEAANINRSLSTLGLVIMTLVDVANGKNRHVPYRDSRLTFLLQDSLGGNSKTTIVANISPSICSSNETLSTLKFAQRAKLIQNNAKVNEDASGDVMALQRQVQELKDQLSFLKKHQNTSRSVCHPSSSFQPVSSGDLYKEHNSFQGGNNDAFSDLSVLQQKVNNLEVALVGSFRREKMTEAEFRMLEAEMKHMNHLMHLMEDDAQRTREMLKLRDEKLGRLELLADDLVSSDGYLMEENIALSKEIQLLREQIDRNPNMSQFALENMRLVDQLRVLQHYCEQGERETLLGEISNLRNHLLHILERKYETPNRPGTQDDEKIMELDICRRQQPACLESNIVVIRNNNLHPQLKQYQEYGQENCSGGDTCSDNHMMQDKDQQYTGELSLIKGDFADGTALCGVDDRVQDVNPYQVKLLTELENVKQENCKHLKFLIREVCERADLERQQEHDIQSFSYGTAFKASDLNNDQVPESGHTIKYDLAARLEKLHKDLEDDKILNNQPKDDDALSIVHMSAAESSVLLSTTNQELYNQLLILSQENAKLRDLVAARDVEITSLSEEWENAIVDLTSFLIDGGKSLENASEYIENVVNLFPQRNLWVNEHVERAIKVNIDKDKIISDLQNNLDNAGQIGQELKAKLDSLRGAALAIMESQQLENDKSSKELFHLKKQQHEKFSQIQELKNDLKYDEDFVIETEKSIDTGSMVTQNLNDMNAEKVLDMEKTELVINELDPKCQVGTAKTLQLKLDDVSQNVDEKANQATSLLLKYEKAQETMEEAELILTALMKANEDAKHERDSWKQATKQLLSEKTVLIEELHQFDAFTSSALQQYKILQKQMHAHLAEVSGIACSIEESFQQIQKITMEGLDAIYSDMSTFGQELISYVGNLRSIINVISHKKERDFNFHVVNQCQLGTLLKQINYLKVNPPSLECREAESCSKSRNVKSCTRVPNIGKTEEVLDESHTVQSMLSVPLVRTDDAGNGKVKLPSKPINSPEKSVQMMNDIMDLTDDIQLLEEKICGLAVFCDNFVQELTSKDIVSVDKQVSNMDSFPAQQKQTSEPVSSDDSSSDMSQDIGADNNFLPDDVAGYFKCEDEVHDDRTKEATSDVEGIFKDIQHLRCQCTRLITSPLATEEVDRLLVHQHDNMQSSVIKVSAMLMHGEKMGMLQNYHPKTGIGKQSLQGLNKIRSNLLYVADTFSSILHFDNEKELNGSLLKKLLRDICIIERKVCTLQQRSSSNGRNQAEIGTDYLSLRREFARKNEIVEGLCFDLRLLQESNSYAQDMKDKNEEITAALIQVQRELTMKNSVIDNILEKQKMLEAQLADNEAALSTSNSELRQAQNLCSMLLKENRELHFLLEDGYSKTAQIEELLEEKNKVINGLEKQILFIRNSAQESIRSSVEEVMNELRRISKERDHLQEEKLDMNDKLELAMSLADEKEAIAVEARQTAETAKIYAEEKEEEVKILERSVEELEDTINALERKVYELKEEVGSYQLIRKDLELEVQALKKRIAMVENGGEVYVAEDLCVTGGKLQIPMKLGDLIIELHEARRYIEDLEMETRCKEEEIKEYKDHISELLMHSEAQSSLFREKFKGLEHMVFEVKADPSTSKPELDVNKIEKSIVRTRGSSSPFRCISSIVQQMNLEKDQELSKAMLRIEELEAIAANKQKEVCLLTTRLVAADIMTHDVIRDLLGVKLDMTNYASLLDQEQLQNLLAKSQQQEEESKAKELEILNLKQQIDHLLLERDSLVEEINQRKSDIISRRMIIEQLQQREELLAAQNEMLKMDKVNLSRKIAELDEKLELLFGLKSIKDHIHQTGSTECTSQNVACEEFSKRLAQSDKLLSHARHDLSRYRNSNHKNLLD
ncbi:kinesin-like protein KIN-12E isoform X2 [Typha latifolia]|uniref:kinesin-like protein KIN-12E isoform X2 n=1 Tax=Typha latifolia TaxID=4733 RepID=UPI003C2ADC1D